MRVARAIWVARRKKMAFKFKFAVKITLLMTLTYGETSTQKCMALFRRHHHKVAAEHALFG